MQLSKPELREHLRALRRELSPAVQETAADNIRRYAGSMDAFIDAQNIAVYWPHDAEINTLPLINYTLAQHKKCFLPVLWLRTRQTLAFASYTLDTPMVKNRYGILEPDLSYSFLIDLHKLDIIFVPLVGFDSQGWRLGRGGGFYDATFADLHQNKQSNWPKLIGLAYSCQEIAHIPVDSWDWQLDAVVTEEKIHQFKLVSK